MSDTDRLAEIRERAIAAAADLRRLIPEPVDYADLVCAEGFAHGQHYVWTEPEPYAMDAAAKVIDDMLTEIDRLTAENARLTERLAAVKDICSMRNDLSTAADCYYCVHYAHAGGDGKCGDGCSFKWRGEGSE